MIIMGIHKVAGIRKAIEARGALIYSCPIVRSSIPSSTSSQGHGVPVQGNGLARYHQPYRRKLPPHSTWPATRIHGVGFHQLLQLSL